MTLEKRRSGLLHKTAAQYRLNAGCGHGGKNDRNIQEGDEKQKLDVILFTTNFASSVSSNRICIIYTPSTFARSSLIHLQETGTLQATHPHKNERNGLSSCLFFTVLRGSGKLTYDGETYALHSGDCVFIDCKKPYSHETGHVLSTSQDGELSTDTTVAVKISADEVGVVKNIMEDGGTV